MQKAPTQLNDKFTNFADKISEIGGRWWVSFICFILIVVWAFSGKQFNYSDSWQLWVNTPTTILELFLGLFTLSAANRVEKRNWELHQNMLKIMQHVELTVEKEQEEIEGILDHDNSKGNG